MDVAKVWVRWNRETFADLSALLLGGPAVVASLMDVVGRAPQITLFLSQNGVHPTPYLRVPVSVELLRRMGFKEEAEKFRRAWHTLYPNPKIGNFPPRLLRTASQAIALVVDTLCYRPFKDLGDKSLAQVCRFGQKEQRMIEEAHTLLSVPSGQSNIPGTWRRPNGR
jgi:hypothetical protein